MVCLSKTADTLQVFMLKFIEINSRRRSSEVWKLC